MFGLVCSPVDLIKVLFELLTETTARFGSFACHDYILLMFTKKSTCLCLSHLTGLEPVTSGLENRCSIQLSYHRKPTMHGYPRRPRRTREIREDAIQALPIVSPTDDSLKIRSGLLEDEVPLRKITNRVCRGSRAHLVNLTPSPFSHVDFVLLHSPAPTRTARPWPHAAGVDSASRGRRQ